MRRIMFCINERFVCGIKVGNKEFAADHQRFARGIQQSVGAVRIAVGPDGFNHDRLAFLPGGSRMNRVELRVGDVALVGTFVVKHAGKTVFPGFIFFNTTGKSKRYSSFNSKFFSFFVISN